MKQPQNFRENNFIRFWLGDKKQIRESNEFS